MTSPVESISENETAQVALNLMLDRHIRHLPVVSADGHLVGMLSVRSLLEHMVADLERELHALDQYISNGGPGG